LRERAAEQDVASRLEGHRVDGASAVGEDPFAEEVAPALDVILDGEPFEEFDFGRGEARVGL
jgi:hypothetical protein